MKRILTALVFLLLLASCRSPQALIKRAIAKDPSILQSTTVSYVDTIKVPVPAYNLRDSVIPVYDTNYIDEYMSSTYKIDPAIVQQIRNKVIADFKKQLEKDTALVTKGNLSAYAYYKNGQLIVDLNQVEDSLTVVHKGEAPCPPQVIMPEKTFLQKLASLWWLWVILLGVSTAMAYKNRKK